MNKLRRFFVSVTAYCALSLTSVSVHASENRYVRVINRASSPIRYLYASNVDVDVWQEDILGAWRIIGTNRYFDVNIDDGSGHCLYDMKAVLADGRSAIQRSVNVCTADTWTVSDSN